MQPAGWPAPWCTALLSCAAADTSAECGGGLRGHQVPAVPPGSGGALAGGQGQRGEQEAKADGGPGAQRAARVQAGGEGGLHLPTRWEYN